MMVVTDTGAARAATCTPTYSPRQREEAGHDPHRRHIRLAPRLVQLEERLLDLSAEIILADGWLDAAGSLRIEQGAANLAARHARAGDGGPRRVPAAHPGHRLRGGGAEHQGADRA